MQMKGEQLPQGTYCMRDIILKMIHSGKYSPGSDWLHPTYGKGLSIDKPESFCAFKIKCALDQLLPLSMMLI